MADGLGSSPSFCIPSKRPKVAKDQVVPGAEVEEPTPPVFTRKLRKAAVGTGCDIRLRVSVAGFPKPLLSWYHNDEILPPSEAQDSGGLWIRDCRTCDAGLYACVATNELGEASCSAVLAIMDLGEGVTVRIFSDLPLSLCIWISAAVAIIYTVFGGLYSVAYTDVVQLLLVFCGLWLCAPFVLASDVYTDITQTAVNHTYQAPWLGHIESYEAWTWVDKFLVMLHIFSQTDLFHSSRSGHCSGIPPILIGAVAASTDWNMTTYGSPSPYERGETAMVLPIVLLHSTPTAVFVIGMGAIASAAMSSTDSCLLAATSIFTTSIYKAIRHQASDRELQWVIRFSIVILGIVGTSLTYLDDNIMTFWILSTDLTYTIILPQLICVLFIRVSNSYGAVAGFVVALVMRVLCGEPVFNLPVILHFPGCTLEDGVYVQRSPFKTICMLSALVSIPMFSYVASLLFNRGIVPERWDVFKVKPQGAPTPEDDARECDEPMLDTRC
ncbi:High affinity choline transporter 1 Hemicholinium-3-sensitive choline transporter [Collichthys lucidus]|uniref:High affinity choline transporter 1 Hemicholinium-3-sensitive choline transporter n=1 Tax=Collichthys lucidus TaxID=240159 RepID=A0A4U5TY22_COLLU|nr:High affinity choline transporter 1 Hemicholinium-3-sensitive choline transporter [Collichthys lucidus]